MPQNKEVDPNKKQIMPLMAFIVILLVLGIFFAVAKADVKQPLDVVKDGVSQAKSIIDDSKLSGNRKKELLHDLLFPLFDFQKMTQMILGNNFKKYETRSAEFTPLLIELIENSYLKFSKIDSAKNAEVVYGETKIDGNYATVDTAILTKNGTKIPVSYRLVLKNGEWRVYDVIIEGVSMVSSYRSQFNRILNQGSSDGRDPFDILLDRIKKNITEAKAADK